MKITIAPSLDHYAGDPAHLQQTVTVEVPNDNINVGQAIELMRNALIAYGYQKEAVDMYIEAQ
jgi:hypothetical protein